MTMRGRSGENLQLFSHLETLVLDKNKLTGLGDFPTLPSVTTLWCNNNNVCSSPARLCRMRSSVPPRLRQIEDLEALCTQIAKRFPRLVRTVRAVAASCAIAHLQGERSAT